MSLPHEVVMGLNLDLAEMLGLPEEVTCPKCRRKTPSYLDDYDIECGNPFPEPGRFSFSMYCQHCDHEWQFTGTVTCKEDELDLGAAL